MKKQFFLIFCLLFLAGCTGAKNVATTHANVEAESSSNIFIDCVSSLAPDESAELASTPFGANLVVSAGHIYTSATNNICRKVSIYSATQMQVIAICQKNGVWMLIDPIFEPVSVYYE